MPSYLLLPPVFRPREVVMPLREFDVLGVPLDWEQIRRIASAICQEPVDDDDQAYDIVAFEVKSLDYELLSLNDIDPTNNRPKLIFAVQDTIKPNRWGEEHAERMVTALTWLRENGLKEACHYPMQQTVVGLPIRGQS